MARLIQSRNPIDLQPSRAVGFGFPLDGDAVFVPTYTTREQTKANLLNYLLTNKGERVFRPNFGANLRSLLFENIQDSTIDDIQASIQRDINVFFPNVIVQQIEFNNEPDNNEINFTLTYEVVNLGIIDNLDILIQ
jgi:phage baseplate assembly protein W